MSRTVRRFQIPLQDSWSLELPRGAQLLAVGNAPSLIDPSVQENVLWVLTTEQATRTFRFLTIYDEIPTDARLGVYLGTFRINGEPTAIAHVFRAGTR